MNLQVLNGASCHNHPILGEGALRNMAYKTIFTALADLDSAKAQLEQAAALAIKLDAHLDVLCIGVDRNQSGFYYGGASAVVIQEVITRAREDSQALGQAATDQLRRAGLRFTVESAVVAMGDVARQVGLRARFADISVIGSPYHDGQSGDQEALIEGALFDGAAPVYVPPSGALVDGLPQNPLLAWDESGEALAAARAALPIMKAAGRVRIVVIDPPEHSANRSDPGGYLSQYLSRHGIRCEIDVLGKSLPRVSDVLLRHAADCDADGIIMGAYGHSRLREAIFGGATRDMLGSGTLPLLMAH